ncbi:RNA exonuclease 1 homolog isoform X1 [Channa argus]|uniref:RNA exonuclease 1 homolog isoform X1 n=2 Tax=Channa argus TaxID=215402 RepID=UPI002945BA27|nr:hypothetical protein Q8A73_011548 [Channa argus]
MFPSSGLFVDIQCPFSKRGPCARPHCLYKHVTEMRHMFGTYNTSVVDSAGVQNTYSYVGCGASVNDETTDDCLQELERINKEIETVRHEVEQEQRRLSCYQTEQMDSKNTPLDFSVSKSKTAGKIIDVDSYILSSCTDFTKTDTRVRKYVVDNSKPRTDLEYDPLSNFSAGLRSYSSSGKEQKHIKKGQSLKRARNSVSCEQKNQLAEQTSWSPEQLDDSIEDSVLIIDIPSSPENKRSRAQKPANGVSGKSQNTEEELGNKSESLFVNSLPLCFSNAETFKTPLRVKANHDPSDAYKGKEGGNILSFGSETGCLEDQESVHRKINVFQAAGTEAENGPEPASLSTTSDQQLHSSYNLVVEEPRCELLHSVANMNPLQPCDFPQKNSIFYKAPAANADPPPRQHTKQAQTEQRAQNKAPNHLSHKQLAPDSQKTYKTPGQVQEKAIINHVSSCVQYHDPADLSVSPYMVNTNESKPTNQLLAKADNEEVIEIDSSSEEELSYSGVELSDSDPMEECYRIFMEANNENKGNEQPETSVGAMDAAKSEVDMKTQALPGKKRVAHEAKHIEPGAKSRPQPQVLVPLRGPATSGFGPEPSVTPRIHQVQQRASMLTASVKGGHAFISSTGQRKPESQTAPPPSTQPLENLQLAPVQNAYMNYIPLGTAVIDMGNNLHLILPEGVFPLPVSSSSCPVTSVLTPINQVHTSTVTVRNAYCPPAITPLQRCRTAPPVFVPASTCKPSLSTTFASAHSSPAALTCPQPAIYAAPAKSVPNKRKLKQQFEAPKEKVPHDVRQRYVNLFTKEFIKTTANVNDAFEKAVAEERTVYNRSVNKLKYLSVAVNALKRLKNQSAVLTKDENQVTRQGSKGNVPLNVKSFKGNVDDTALYESLTDYILTEERLIESNYPVQHPEKPGCAVLFADSKKGNTDPFKKICCRCGATYSVSQTGKHIRKEECNYHYGKGVENKVPGGVETRYSCCEGVMGAPGCQVFKLHVHDSLSLDGFVSTVPRHPSDRSCPKVYSLDCEMCYTIHGLELSRVTVVNSSLQVIYDTFVKPDNEVIDYNTRFSGIGEEDVKGNHTSLKEVQQILLSFISADTILIGHGLETDLCALKLLHGMVVDTSVVFPHRLGPPRKQTLNDLTAEYLRRIIQESVCGHDTAEDAAACMELMLWKVKEDGRLKK